MTADVPDPAVRVVDDEQASCYTVGRFTDATVVVTGLIEQLDAEELEAVLAHEIAHIANRDVTLMTITTLFLEIATRAFNSARLARRAVTHPDEVSDTTAIALRFFIPLAVLTYVSPRCCGSSQQSHTGRPERFRTRESMPLTPPPLI